MMVRIRTIVSALALCAASLPTLAAAQTVEAPRTPPTPALAPDANAPAAPAEDELDGPELPPVPESLRDRVADLTRVADETSECYTSESERAEHTPDRRCAGWYAQLTRGGAASVHAIGAVLLRPVDAPNSVRGPGEWERGARLVQVMLAASPTTAMPYLLRTLSDRARAGHAFFRTEQEILRQLPRATGDEVAPRAPWESPYALWTTDVARAHATAAWLRWWRTHQGETRAQWMAAAESRAVADLTSPDPAVRFSAMQRLASVPAHRGAVAAALRDLLASDDLPARAVVHLRRWAQRARIPVPATTTLASRN